MIVFASGVGFRQCVPCALRELHGPLATGITELRAV